MKCVNATKVFCIDAIVNRKYNIDIKINCKFIGWYLLRYRKKKCFVCNEYKEILYRCRYQENFIEREKVYGDWVFVCSLCLKDIKKKFMKKYQYGGTWKSKKK